MAEGRQLPALTAEQMAAVDRAMYEQFGLDVLQIMELAGRAVATFARQRFLAGEPRGRRVLVLAGSGGNGGDAMVAARHLLAWGADVTVLVTHPVDHLHGPAAHQAQVLTRLGLTLTTPPAGSEQHLPAADLVIDGLLGFSLHGAPRGLAADLIRAANAQPAPVLAIDVPSGLDATTDQAADPCIQATATLTLALPKTGLLQPAGRRVAGDLFVADIGVLPAALATVGVEVGPLFAEREVIAVRPG